MDKKEFLGEKSYLAIVSKIKDRVLNTDAATLEGQDALNKLHTKLNESATPMLDVRDIIMNKELRKKDNCVDDLCAYCADEVKSGDLNFVINLCKEEHLRNMMKINHHNPIATIQDIEEYFDEPVTVIEVAVADGKFDNLQSELFQNVKQTLNIEKQANRNFDRKNSSKTYKNIVSAINDRLQNAQCDTEKGSNLVKELYSKLNEEKSITPMMEVKDFITNAQQISKDDAKLKDIVDFCKKNAQNNGLNYIINLCKEEHFANLKRAGHPDPIETVKDAEKLYDEGDSVIEQGIHNGLFDNLNSKLLNNVKTSLGIKVKSEEELQKELNESYQYDFGGVCQYTPVGVCYEDKTNNRMTILCESDVLSFDKVKHEYHKVKDVEVTPEYRRLMESVTTLCYDPETEMYSLNENWDFKLHLNTKDNKAYISKLNEDNFREISKEKTRSLLFESIKSYDNGKYTPENYNRNSFIRDADNFLCLMENSNSLVKLDELRVLRNLNEDKYIMFDMHDVKAVNTPKILSRNGECSNVYDSFQTLNESVKEFLKYDCSKLFENEMKAEQEQLNTRQETIVSLVEQQKELNENINNVKNLKKLAEENSPAMDKLNEQERILNGKLEENIKELNFYQNEFQLHHE